MQKNESNSVPFDFGLGNYRFIDKISDILIFQFKN